MMRRKRGREHHHEAKNLIFPVVPKHLLMPFLAVSGCFVLAVFNIQAGLRISTSVEGAIINRVLSGRARL
jgi:hypothetical protein